MRLVVKFGDICIGMDASYAFLPHFCRAYIYDGTPAFWVTASQEEIDEQLHTEGCGFSAGYAEALCLHRKIAEKIPFYGSAVFHGAAISYQGKAYLFTAPSGTGKSTHIRLWQRYLGKPVGIINGDKPILSFSDSGITVCGTPYAGKEGWQANVQLPLGGICILSQSPKNTIVPLSPSECMLPLLQQIYRPEDRAAMAKTLTFVDQLCRQPIYHLACSISEDAVRQSFSAMTGLSYEECHI